MFFINVIVILIAVILLVAMLFLGAFLWAVKNGQYKDTFTPSVRMLFDNDNNSSEIKEDNSI